MLINSIKNAIFSFACIGLIGSSIAFNIIITNNIEIAEKLYFGGNLSLIITSIFANLCLGVFGILILGNLNDFVLYRILNLIGAYQKLKILAILVITNTTLYLISGLYCHLKLLNVYSKNNLLFFTVFVLVFLFESFLLFSINSIHPDLLGLKWMRDLKAYDNGEYHNVYFI